MSYKERVITTKGYSRLATEADDGVNMVRDLEEKKTIKSETEPKILIPFHAVDRVVKTVAMEDREDRNPYGCEPSGGGGGASGSKVCAMEVCAGKVAC